MEIRETAAPCKIPTCSGKIVAKTGYPPSRGPMRIGPPGPPVMQQILGYHCNKCGIKYEKLEDKEATEKILKELKEDHAKRYSAYLRDDGT